MKSRPLTVLAMAWLLLLSGCATRGYEWGDVVLCHASSALRAELQRRGYRPHVVPLDSFTARAVPAAA